MILCVFFWYSFAMPAYYIAILRVCFHLPKAQYLGSLCILDQVVFCNNWQLGLHDILHAIVMCISSVKPIP